MSLTCVSAISARPSAWRAAPLAQRRSGHDFLAYLDRRGKLLQHAVEAGPHLQLVYLALLQVELPAKLLDFHLLGRQLRLFGVAVDGQALLLEFHPATQLLCFTAEILASTSETGPPWQAPGRGPPGASRY